MEQFQQKGDSESLAIDATRLVLEVEPVSLVPKGVGAGVGAGVGVVVCTYLPHCVCVAAGCEEERPKHSVQCGNDILSQEVSVHVNVW